MKDHIETLNLSSTDFPQTDLTTTLQSLDEHIPALAETFEPKTETFDDFNIAVNNLSKLVANIWYTHCFRRFSTLYKFRDDTQKFMDKFESLAGDAVQHFKQSIELANSKLRNRLRETIADRLAFSEEKEQQISKLKMQEEEVDDKVKSMNVQLTGRTEGCLSKPNKGAIKMLNFAAALGISVAEVVSGFGTFKSQSDPLQALGASILYVVSIIVAVKITGTAANRIMGYYNAKKAYKPYKNLKGDIVELHPFDYGFALKATLGSALFLITTLGVFIWRLQVAQTGNIMAGSPIIAGIQAIGALAYLVGYISWSSQHDEHRVAEVEKCEQELQDLRAKILEAASSKWDSPIEQIHEEYQQEISAAQNNAATFAATKNDVLTPNQFDIAMRDLTEDIPEYEQQRKATIEEGMKIAEKLFEEVLLRHRGKLNRKKLGVDDEANRRIVQDVLVSAISETPSLQPDAERVQTFNPQICFPTEVQILDLEPVVAQITAEEEEKSEGQRQKKLGAEEKRNAELRQRKLTNNTKSLSFTALRKGASA